MFSWQAKLWDRQIPEPFYVEQNIDTGLYEVYGCESGFCYASYFYEDEAEEHAEQMNQKNLQRREHR